jgi:hypothetical protein
VLSAVAVLAGAGIAAADALGAAAGAFGLGGYVLIVLHFHSPFFVAHIERITI